MLSMQRLVSRLGLGYALPERPCFPLLPSKKDGMPDLSQEEQTCLPTSTANLIVWFGSTVIRS